MAEQIMAEELKEKLRNIFTDIDENDLNKIIRGLGRYWSEDIEACLIFLQKKPVPVTIEERGANGRLLGWKMVEKPREINENLYTIEDIAETLRKVAVTTKGDDEVIKIVTRTLKFYYPETLFICQAIKNVADLFRVENKEAIKFIAEFLTEIRPMELYDILCSNFDLLPRPGFDYNFEVFRKRGINFHGIQSEIAQAIGIVAARVDDDETIIAIVECLKKYIPSRSLPRICALFKFLSNNWATWEGGPDYAHQTFETMTLIAKKLSEDEIIKIIQEVDEEKLRRWIDYPSYPPGKNLYNKEVKDYYLNPQLISQL